MVNYMLGKKQKIKCTVYDCKYCKCDDKLCELSCISVEKCGKYNSKVDTICASYKKR